MITFEDLKKYQSNQDFKVIIAADASTRSATLKNGKLDFKIPAGGVGVAFDPISKAVNATYIGRGKVDEVEIFKHKRQVKSKITDANGSYDLVKLFFSDEELEDYYYGFANQTLWPLCHVAFERPQFKDSWFEGYVKVNHKYADAIKSELKKKNFVWVNDYHLCMVPSLLKNPKNTTIGMFWHIPWPTWEIFRIMPHKKEILESLLSCDYLAFHRGYHMRNFINTVERELEARIDLETQKIYYKGKVTTVSYLPMGIDADVIKSLSGPKKALTKDLPKKEEFEDLFSKYKVILGVDRLDYTKGLALRLWALDLFFKKYPKYIKKLVYVGIIAPSREPIESYQALKKQVRETAADLNEKYGTSSWQPVIIFNNFIPREQLMQLYQRADVCLVTPRDDGMNLVSKEFVLASSTVDNPGMLVLSKFAGSAIDLRESLIINPYDFKEMSESIKRALEMDPKEKKQRINDMASVLEERNVYEWALNFFQQATSSAKEKIYHQIYR
jgi:trehalose 6-phosphate synthase/phosphatase